MSLDSIWWWLFPAYLLFSAMVSGILVFWLEGHEPHVAQEESKAEKKFTPQEVSDPLSSNTPGGMTEDFEFEQYIHAFSSSSNRVRYVVIIITIASMLVLTNFWNARQKSWIQARIRTMRDTLEVFEKRKQGSYMPLPEAALIRNLETEEAVKIHLEQLENAYVSRVVEPQIPILGLSFDMNDLGIFGGTAFMLLLILLAYCLMRQYENLFLSLWKVETLYEKDRIEARESKANLLYHALAMAQVFTLPPTLARWRPNSGASHLAKSLFFLPLIAHVLVVGHNFRTLQFATTLKAKFPGWGMRIQVYMGLVLFFLAVLCCIYSRACDERWRRIFFRINPSCEKMEQRSWLRRMMILR